MERGLNPNTIKTKMPGPGGVLDKGSDEGVRQISLHPVTCRIKDVPNVYPVAYEFCQNPLFQENFKRHPST